MGKIILLPETTKNPITVMGQRASVCWNGNTSDNEKNYKRGLDCIKSNHGRVLEYVNVEMILDGYSARVIREWYTHIGGSPSRLQSSTRYIDYSNFNFVTPESISSNEEALGNYVIAMTTIMDSCDKLKELGIPREDIGMLLPLGMTTKVVDKRNLRNLVEMSHQRMCHRACLEYRRLFKDISEALSAYSEEWTWITNNIFKPKCKYFGKCTENNSCRKDGKE